MSEEPAWYNQTLSDGPWSVRWSVRPDYDAPVGIAITDRDGVTAIPLNRQRAERLRAALDEALRHAPYVLDCGRVEYKPERKE
jgi:hypothetical protein